MRTIDVDNRLLDSLTATPPGTDVRVIDGTDRGVWTVQSFDGQRARLLDIAPGAVGTAELDVTGLTVLS